jgi:hypothetical protein
MEQKLEGDFEKWLMSYDISLSFQNIRKNHCMKRWKLLCQVYPQPSRRGNVIDKLNVKTAVLVGDSGLGKRVYDWLDYSHLLIEKQLHIEKNPG